MDFEFYEPYGQPLNTADIKTIESEVGHELPADFRDFLMERGGGDIIAETEISFHNIKNDVLVLFGKDGELDLRPTGRDLRRGDQLAHYPEHSLIVADDLGGNSYFACWDDGKFSIRWMGYLDGADHVHVANTFTEFLNKIQTTPYAD